MGIIRTIKQRAGQYFLEKEDVSRNRRGSNFSQARSVLILYLDEGESHYKKVKNYVKYLKEEHGMREVMALGFVDLPEKDLPVYQKHQLEIEFFSRSDLNWYMKPQGAFEKHLEKDYDILVDLVFEPSLPMAFALAMSKAKMKVGKSGSPGESQCDLVLNMEGRDNTDEFIYQVNHYLSKYAFQ